jgi:hypothetical protein
MIAATLPRVGRIFPAQRLLRQGMHRKAGVIAAAGVQGLGLRTARIRAAAAQAETSDQIGQWCRRHPTQRIAAALLAITVICMAASRYA